MAPTTHAAKARRDELAELIQHLAPEKNVESLLPWAEKLVHDQKYASSIERHEVLSHFHGLVEKLRVVSRVDLSKALETRVNQLDEFVQDSRLFSVLQTASMLLDIPNDPLTTPRKLDLDSHRITKPEPQLTWHDIVGSEPFSGEHWELDLGSDNGSETDEADEKDQESESDDDDQIELDIDRTYEPLPRPLEQYVLQSGATIAVKSDIVRESYWIDRSQFISESNVIRECLFALLGYPSELFESINVDGLFEVKPVYGWILAHSSPQALHGVLEGIGRHATVLSQLREFSDAYFVKENFPNFDYNFIFGTLDKFVQRVTRQLIKLQDSLLDEDTTVSLLALSAQVADIVEPYTSLVQAILNAAQSAGHTRVELLNLLFKTISLAEVSFDNASLSILIEAYTAIFNDYPLGLWITRGVSQDADFFVTSAVARAAGGIAAQSWSEARRSTSRNAPTPAVISDDMADLIFDAGKAAMLLCDAGKTVRFVWQPLALDSSEEFINALSTQVRNARNSNVLQLSDYIFDNCGLGAVLKLYRDIYFLHDTSGAMPRFVTYINEHDIDRYSAVDALEEAYSGERPPVNVSAVTGSGNVVLVVPLKNDLLASLFDRSAIAKYNSIFSVLVKLSRWHSRAKHAKGWAPIVFSQALCFTDMMIRSKVDKFLKIIMERRETHNIFEAHNAFLAEIERHMPTTGRYEQSGLLSDLVDEVSKKLGVRF